MAVTINGAPSNDKDAVSYSPIIVIIIIKVITSITTAFRPNPPSYTCTELT